jgi:PAS domain S-box-containing protein
LRPHEHPDAADLLRTEHAAVRVLATAESEAEAFPALLAAIGTSLGCAGSLWLAAPELHCVETWPADNAAGAELVHEVWETQRPASRAGPPATFAFPLPGVGVMGFSTSAPLEPDQHMLATMDSLGLQISHFAERCQAVQAVHASDARKSAILDSAFDCIITMDHLGNVVEVNRATEKTFGYKAEEMIGRELAALIVPPSWRKGHRAGVEKVVRTGHSSVGGHPLEGEGMRKDGSIFPVELIVTRPQVAGPPLFTGYLRDVTETRRRESALRRLAAEQAALKRVATSIAAGGDPAESFAVVTEELARLLNAQTATLVRFDGNVALTVGAWNQPGVRGVPVGTRMAMEGDSVATRVFRTQAPARVDDYELVGGTIARELHRVGFRSAVAAPVFLNRSLWGAMIVLSVDTTRFPEGAEQRIADFAELAAQALANAQAREELAASRARIVQAGDAERRRLERNLHDGAQQRLVSLALMLRLAARRHPEDETLGQAGEELAEALKELRELARGIHPAVLTERGLEPAVRALADRSQLPVELSVDVDGRLPDPVEAAAYYVVAEALTNVAKYAGASEVTVGVHRDNGQARIEVRDDGIGGADAGGGSGLRGLADRVEALGGRLQIDSPRGAGTTLRAEIPCTG